MSGDDEPKPPTTLGGRLKRLRKAQRMSQQYVGDHAGMSAAWVGKVERGASPSPGGRPLERLAAVLGTTVDALLTGRGVDSGRADAAGRLPGGAGSAPEGSSSVAPPPGGLSPDAPPALSCHNPGGGSGGGARLAREGEARFCPGYWLWRRDDPRVAACERVALTPGNRVMCEEGDGVLPGSVFVVRVDDPGPLAAVVGPEWHIFVDRNGAAQAAAGQGVAALTRRWGLAVGELGGDDAGGWFLQMGREREPIERGDVLGRVLKAQPPARWHLPFGAAADDGG